jgi:hypothetical protein
MNKIAATYTWVRAYIAHEPVRSGAIVVDLMAVAAAFGLPISTTASGAILTLGATVLGLSFPVRNAVFPMAKMDALKQLAVDLAPPAGIPAIDVAVPAATA